MNALVFLQLLIKCMFLRCLLHVHPFSLASSPCSWYEDNLLWTTVKSAEAELIQKWETHNCSSFSCSSSAPQSCPGTSQSLSGHEQGRTMPLPLPIDIWDLGYVTNVTLRYFPFRSLCACYICTEKIQMYKSRANS